MQSDIKNILHQAEESYLKDGDVKLFQTHVANLAKRLEIYELLRDREIEIFQPIADELLKIYPEENPQLIEKALKHWLSIMRYCGMATLLNNPEYLQRSILEWVTDMVRAHQMQSIENAIYDLLSSDLQRLLSQDKFALIEPFLEQTQAILGDKITSAVGAEK